MRLYFYKNTDLSPGTLFHYTLPSVVRAHRQVRAGRAQRGGSVDLRPGPPGARHRRQQDAAQPEQVTRDVGFGWYLIAYCIKIQVFFFCTLSTISKYFFDY